MSSADFTPTDALVGGALIGIAAAGMWLFLGRIAGVSGIVGRALFRSSDRGWRLAFVAGLVGGGLLASFLLPGQFEPSGRPLALLGAAGILVGVGTSLGNGCTSGHGVCGVARLSARSIAATLTFVTTGALSVALLGWLGLT